MGKSQENWATHQYGEDITLSITAKDKEDVGVESLLWEGTRKSTVSKGKIVMQTCLCLLHL